MAIVIPIVTKFIDEGLADAKSEFQKAQGTFEKTAAAASAMAGPAKAIVAGLAGAGVKVAKEAAGAAKANQVLADSFKNVGYEENAAAAEKFADSLSRTIGVQDEEIKKTMGMLTAYDSVAASSELMAQVTTAAADMSAKGFGSMDSAAKLLGKAMEDPIKGVTSLGRAGVQFTEQQREQVKAMVEVGDTAGAQALIMEEVQKKMGGAAESSATQTDKLKVAFGEAAEALGAVLLPLLPPLTALLESIAGFMEDNAKGFMIAAGAVGALSVAIIVLNAGMKVYTAVTTAGTVAQKLWTAATKVGTAAAKVFGLAIKAMSGPIGWITAAIVALAVVVIKNWDQIKEWTLKVWDWIGNFLTDLWNDIKRIASNTFDWIKEKIGNVWDAVKAIFKVTPFGMVLNHMDEIKRWIGNGFDWIKDKVDTVWDWVKGVFKVNPFGPVQGFLDSMEGWFERTFASIKGKIDDLLGKVNDAVDTIQGAWDRAKDLVDNMPKPGKGKAAASGMVAVSAMPATAVLARGVDGQEAVPVHAAPDRTITINIHGALDPEATARRIRQILDKSDLRNGRTLLRPVAW